MTLTKLGHLNIAIRTSIIMYTQFDNGINFFSKNIAVQKLGHDARVNNCFNFFGGLIE